MRVLPLASLLAAGLLLAPPAAFGDDPAPAAAPPVAPAPPAPSAPVPPPARPPLPAGVVARAGTRDVPRAEFQRQLARALRPDFADPGSGAATVVAIVIAEEVVAQEAARLGIVVTPADVEARYKAFDAQLRAQSAKRGEAQTLEDVMKEAGKSREEFRLQLEDLVRKERIAAHPQYLGKGFPEEPNAQAAQIEVVVGELMKKAKVERDGLPAGTSLRVNGKPISDETLGAALEMRLSKSEVRRQLNEYCLTLLFGDEAKQITDAQVDEEIEAARPLWQRARDEALTPEMQTLDFETFLQMRFNAPMAELRSSPYRRGIFALRRRIRSQITKDDVLKAYASGARGEFGPSVLVTEIMTSFRASNTLTEPVKRRARDDALRVIRGFERRLKGGEPPEAIEKEIKAAGDRGVVFERRLLLDRERGNDMQLFAAARALADGAWSEPIETMSEYTLLRRDRARPAPTLEAVRPIVRERLIDEQAMRWQQERLLHDIQTAE